MIHPEQARLDAYFDQEMDVVEATEIERHAGGCDECRAYLRQLADTRAVLRSGPGMERAPPALRARLSRELDRMGAAVAAPRHFSRPFWAGALTGGCAAASAAVLAFILWAPSLNGALVDDLVGAHLRSLMPDHLVDVVSTDRHTVKPWFAGHTDVSPAVEDFASQGYQLIGGRADYVERQRAAVLIYRHGAHVINVFSWADAQHALPQQAVRNGYQLIFWRSGDLDYCAVSDTAPDELRGLVHLLQGLRPPGS